MKDSHPALDDLHELTNKLAVISAGLDILNEKLSDDEAKQIHQRSLAASLQAQELLKSLRHKVLALTLNKY